MRVPQNYILVEKTEYEKVGEFDISTCTQAQILAVEEGYWDADSYKTKVNVGDIVLLEKKWTKYRELKDKKVYLVPIYDIMMIYEEDEVLAEC